MKKSLIIGALMGLAACGETQNEDAGSAVELIKPSATEISFAQDAVPSDAALAAKYDRSCRSCHALPDSGAPLTGHKVAWDVRFEAKKIDALVASSKAGLEAMPAMGLCNDCSDEEFARLIMFMAGRSE